VEKKLDSIRQSSTHCNLGVDYGQTVFQGLDEGDMVQFRFRSPLA
jgi:hypothetical protein